MTVWQTWEANQREFERRVQARSPLPFSPRFGPPFAYVAPRFVENFDVTGLYGAPEIFEQTVLRQLPPPVPSQGQFEVPSQRPVIARLRIGRAACKSLQKTGRVKSIRAGTDAIMVDSLLLPTTDLSPVSKSDPYAGASFGPGTAFIPLAIQDVALIIHGIKKNHGGLPVKQDLAKINAFTARGSMKTIHPLRSWYGDTRLFDEKTWKWLAGVRE